MSFLLQLILRPKIAASIGLVLAIAIGAGYMYMKGASAEREKNLLAAHKKEISTLKAYNARLLEMNKIHQVVNSAHLKRAKEDRARQEVTAKEKEDVIKRVSKNRITCVDPDNTKRLRKFFTNTKNSSGLGFTQPAK